MKRKFYLTLIILSLIAIPISAQEKDSNITEGFKFGAGGTLSFTPTLYQDISYNIIYGNGLGFNFGLEFQENMQFIFPYAYIFPYASFIDGCFHISGGFGFFLEMNLTDEWYRNFFIEMGWELGNWDWGPGIGNIDFGIQWSLTPIIDTESVGSAIGSVLVSVLGCLKAYVGVTYFIPF